MPRKKATEELKTNDTAYESAEYSVYEAINEPVEDIANVPTNEPDGSELTAPDDQTTENTIPEPEEPTTKEIDFLELFLPEAETTAAAHKEAEATVLMLTGTEATKPESMLPTSTAGSHAPAAYEAPEPMPTATEKTPQKKPKRKAKEPAPASPLPASAKIIPSSSILTISTDGEAETPGAREDLVWHELQNAYRTRKILTGSLGGIERTEGGGSIAVVYYKELRVAIPIGEMMVHLAEDDSHDYGELASRQNKIIGNMLGAEIDFIVKGLDASSRSVVASRKDAMYKKRQIFYLPDASGSSRVHEDRIVQARVIAVAEKVVRVEIFGVECSILARDLSWDWLGDAHERFQVGGQILVRILHVRMAALEDISVKADVKSVAGNTSKASLSRCKVQGKYAGTVTDVHKGTVFVRLSTGVNAIAHSCYDSRMPGKKDEVSFVVTRIDEERNVAVGLISRIIRSAI